MMRATIFHMYGAANFTIVDDVRKLPYKLSDIYRKLTTQFHGTVARLDCHFRIARR